MPAGASAWVTDLESLSSRTMMRDFPARAYVHRAGLGVAGALEAARIVSAESTTRLDRAIAERAAGAGGPA